MTVIANSPNIQAAGWQQVTPVVSTSAYTSGNSVGGKLTLSNACRSKGGAIILNDIVVTDEANQKAALTILFFNQPLVGTVADFATPALIPDINNCIGKVTVAAADYVTLGSDSAAVAQESSLNLLLYNAETVATQNIYFIIITTGTPTYVAADDLTITFKFNASL